MNALQSWIVLLLAILFPAVDGDGKDGADDGGDGGGGDGGGSDDLDLSDVDGDGQDGQGDGADGGEGQEGGDGGADGGEGGKQTRGQRDFAALRQRAREAEEREKRAREEAETLRRQISGGGGQPQQTDEQRLYEQEERKLRDPETTAQERWQIESNRTIRATRADAARARAEATEMSDRTRFDLLCSQNQRYAKVKEKVEERRAKIIQAGQMPPPREAMAIYILGEMVANAKPGKRQQPQRDQQQQVNRGKSSNARSDTPGRGQRLTESQARRKRLEGVQI